MKIHEYKKDPKYESNDGWRSNSSQTYTAVAINFLSTFHDKEVNEEDALRTHVIVCLVIRKLETEEKVEHRILAIKTR